MSTLDALRESIEHALAPPDPDRIGPARRLARRLAMRAGQARARYQQQIDRQFLDLLRTVEGRLSEIDDSLASASRGHEELRSWLANTDADLRANTRLNGELSQQTHALRERVERLEAARGIHAATDLDLETLRLERFDAGQAGRVIGYRNGGAAHAPEQDYIAFEDVFRLSEDVIRERQRPYVSLLDGRRPVLDVGCGRGEFLELLREAAVPARGVDLDPGMVARARAKDLDVEHSDAVAYLERLADESLGVVFAAQVVEHLPYPTLLAFLRLSYRKLEPGGLLVAETVNPHVPWALKNFWLDLTHQHPIFPEVLLTLCRGFGFESAYVFHPGGSRDVDADRVRCGDYAVVAERAEARPAPNAVSA